MTPVASPSIVHASHELHANRDERGRSCGAPVHVAQSLDMAGYDIDSGHPPAPAPVSAPVAESSPVSAAVQRFQTCRWRKATEAGVVDHCTHRDVLPMTGITGFEADSWCTECGFYKIKRTPRKHIPQENRYY